MYTHACTLFSSLIILPAPFRLPAAGIFPPFLCAFLLPFSSWCFCDCFAAISLLLCRQTYILFYTFSSLLQPIFCTSFSSYIIHRECRPSMKSIWEEKSCKIKKEKYVHFVIFKAHYKDFIQTEKKIKVNKRKRKKKREK